jgi:hypothetical protein
LPYQVVLGHRPAGYTRTGALEGDEVEVVAREFTSSEDGELFVSRLEGLPNDLLAMVPHEARITPSRVDHLVGIIEPDLRTTLYINECNFVAHAVSARAVAAGEEMTVDDILDIARVDIEGVDCPPEAGIVCVFSAGWRKGLYFDLEPLLPEAGVRTYHVNEVLGPLFAYLHNQTVLSLSEEEWTELFRQRWFPFASLPKAILEDLIGAIRSDMTADVFLPKVSGAVRELSPQLMERWRSAPAFQEHVALLERALERYLAEDYLSATALLYPRIEGILRTIHWQVDESSRPSPRNLAAAGASSRNAAHEYSWLLPGAFKRFLEQVYFADFKPGQVAPLSRHSIGHGVASVEDFDLKSGTIAILIVDQLWCLIPKPR